MIRNEDGLAVLKEGGWDHILTDPDYVNQPDSGVYRQYCQGNIILFCDATLRPPGKSPDEVLFWLKPQSTKWSTKRCNKFIEEILVYRSKKLVFNMLHWSSMTGMFQDGFVVKPPHPYAKPLSLAEKLVLLYTNPGDLIFDPFCGSATMGVAALKHGRRYVGCEINPEFYSLASKRFDLATSGVFE